jgi:hypothetical protein
MEMESHNHFKKLWGKIDKKLDRGKYKLKVLSRFDAAIFEGTKSVFLMTPSIIGTSMLFSIIMVVGSGICFVFIIFLCICKNIKKQMPRLNY